MREGKTNTQNIQKNNECISKTDKTNELHSHKKVYTVQQQILPQNVYSTQKAEATPRNVLDTIMSPMHRVYYPQCSSRKLKLRQYIPALKSLEFSTKDSFSAAAC